MNRNTIYTKTEYLPLNLYVFIPFLLKHFRLLDVIMY